MKRTKITALLLAVIMLISILPLSAAAQNIPSPYEDSLYYEIGDYNIHYRIWEAQDEKGKIMMIHGFALSSYCWENLAKVLTENGYTCVLPDLPDFGYSSRETKDTDYMAREDIIYSLMMSIDTGSWYVAGHSMGGYIALALAQKYPQNVKNLLLYGTSGNDGFDEKIKAIATNDFTVRLLGSFMELMAKSDLLVRFLLAVGLHDAAYARTYDLSKVTAPLRIKGTGAGALYSWAMLPATDYESVKSMSPVFYINGTDDNVIQASARDKFRTYLPQGSEDITVVGGHMFIENNSDVSGLTLSFLEAHV